MDKKKLEYFRKGWKTRQKELRHMVGPATSRTSQRGRPKPLRTVAGSRRSSYNRNFSSARVTTTANCLLMVDGASPVSAKAVRRMRLLRERINAKRLEAFPGLATGIEMQEKAEQGLLETNSLNPNTHYLEGNGKPCHCRHN